MRTHKRDSACVYASNDKENKLVKKIKKNIKIVKLNK